MLRRQTEGKCTLFLFIISITILHEISCFVAFFFSLFLCLSFQSQVKTNKLVFLNYIAKRTKQNQTKQKKQNQSFQPPQSQNNEQRQRCLRMLSLVCVCLCDTKISILFRLYKHFFTFLINKKLLITFKTFCEISQNYYYLCIS